MSISDFYATTERAGTSFLNSYLTAKKQTEVQQSINGALSGDMQSLNRLMRADPNMGMQVVGQLDARRQAAEKAASLDAWRTGSLQLQQQKVDSDIEANKAAILAAESRRAAEEERLNLLRNPQEKYGTGNPDYIFNEKDGLWKAVIKGDKGSIEYKDMPQGFSPAKASSDAEKFGTGNPDYVYNKDSGRWKSVITGDKGTVSYKDMPEGFTPPPKAGSGDGAGGLGSRESIFIGRVLTSANEAAADLANIVELPIESSTGWFGGRKQGTTLLGATKEVLANKMTSQDVQSYNVMTSGIQRSLAGIESQGLVPSGLLSHQMDAVVIKEGDTYMTKMQKLAQIRQIIEKGLDATIANKKISDEQRELAYGILKSIEDSVPFTQKDLIRLGREQEKNPDITMSDMFNEKKEKTSEHEKAVQWAKEHPDTEQAKAIMRMHGGGK